MSHESRDFIPTGNCVEESKALFTGPDTAELAKQACLSCVQLPYCQDQRDVIGTILRQRGEEDPVVGGAIAADKQIDTSPVQQYGEITLQFNRQRLPKDGVRALRSQQQAMRANQITPQSLSVVKGSPLDIVGWLQERMAYTFEGGRPLGKLTLASILNEVGGHILTHGGRRAPNGNLAPKHLRYRDLNLEDYSPYAEAFIQEAIAHAAMGFTEPARRTSYHSKDFHVALFREGEKHNISSEALMHALKNSPLTPLQTAIQRKASLSDRSGKYKVANRQARKKAESKLDTTLEELFSEEGLLFKDYISKLFDYGVISVRQTNGQPQVSLSPTYKNFNAVEQSAIIHALGLTKFASKTHDRREITKALQTDNLEDFVFTVLMPHASPETLQLDSIKDIGGNPAKLLRLTRLKTWGKRIKFGANPMPAEVLDNLLNTLPPDQHTFWSNYLPYIRRLYTAGKQANHNSLDAATFTQLFLCYQEDVQALIASKAESLAPQIAFFYTPRTYLEIVEYAKRNPNISTAFINSCFKGNAISPLQMVRKFENTYEALQKMDPVQLAALRPGDIKKLALRGVQPDGAIKIIKTLEYLTSKYEGIVNFSKIRAICVNRKGSTKELEELVKRHQKRFTFSWQREAACKDIDSELFYPAGTSGPAVAQAEKALNICGKCSVKLACLKTTLDNPDLSGVSGGVWWDKTEAVDIKHLKTLAAKVIME